MYVILYILEPNNAGGTEDCTSMRADTGKFCRSWRNDCKKVMTSYITVFCNHILDFLQENGMMKGGKYYMRCK